LRILRISMIKQITKTFCLLLVVGGFLLQPLVSLAAPGLSSMGAAGLDPMDSAEVSVEGVTAGLPTSNPGEQAGDVVEDTSEKLIKKPVGIIVKSILAELITFVFNRLSYDAAVYLASGGKAQDSAFVTQDPAEYFTELGLDTAGEAFASLTDILDETLNMDFDICAPGDPFLRLGLQLGIRSAYDRPKPRCEFQDFVKNWSSVIAGFQKYKQLGKNPSEFFLNEFKKAYSPGQNTLDATVGANIRVQEQVLEKKMSQWTANLSMGWFKPVQDLVTGNIETPAAMTQRKVEAALIEDPQGLTIAKWQQTVSDDDLLTQGLSSVASTFLNTLLSEFLDNLFTGLFTKQPEEDDLWGDEVATGSGFGGREVAMEQFKELLTMDFAGIDNYSALSELIACPGPDSRGLYNCSMDAAFASAISRASSGDPMTIGEALEQDLLKGDWPLIPASDYARNQDTYCYTYGYCYGNLVKMRKFRVISVGWEIAANSPFNSSSNPVTLSEVVDSFNDCSPDGNLTATYPWCHLIDPNWVLKVPETQCAVAAPNELLMNSSTNIRIPTCTDTPSCLGEDDDGECVDGYGYCTREENIWRFRGNSCPEEYASCLSFSNTDTNENGNWLLNTVDFDSCTADNAGCRWYRTNKYEDDYGTVDFEDDEFVWLATGDDFVTADRDLNIQTTSSDAEEYSYDTDGDGIDDFSYAMYAYQDRRYFNNDVIECSEDYVGCTELITKDENVILNVIANPSFEDDEDEDGIPDFWNGIDAADYYTEDDYTIYNLDHVRSTASSEFITQESIVLAPNRFYTFSFYAQESDSGSGSESLVKVSLINTDTDPNAEEVILDGTTILGDCSQIDDNAVRVGVEDPLDEATRFSCTFTTPGFESYATVTIQHASGEAVVDAFMLEEGSVLHDFQSGYGNSTITNAYLRLPPAYLGCTGAATDPTECDDYAQVCAATEVGCERYTPADGDPAVPAIVNSIDYCPSECVGYDTYKQEATLYDDEDPLLYFIPETAGVCNESEVGCDEFTNLDDVAAGGEGLEYYTYLRSCSLPENLAPSEYATYFTWEGSEQTGYQLQTWTLLKSGISEAPCTSPVLDGPTSLTCIESSYTAPDDCDEHDDIFANPDCREFYDGDGDIHYREFSSTATITDSCHPYRKSEASEGDCDNSGGYWTAGGECRYLGYPDESIDCDSAANGCRSYTGGAGRNASIIFTDTVENGDLEDWFGTADAVISSESVVAGGHSIYVSNGGRLDLLYLEEDDATDCTGSDICELTDGGGSSCEIVGTDELDYCGPLTGGLVAGKTYILSFWAKGTGDLDASFVEQGGDIHYFQDSVSLSGGWQLYTMGPLDTSGGDFGDFDDTALLRIQGDGQYYIDNIYLKEAEDNITLIENSWVTPSTCDMTYEGVVAPQFYLGCEAYSDTDGYNHNLFQFSSICSDDAVGCESYFDTQNSDSVFPEAYNVTCNAITTDGSASLFSEDPTATSPGICSRNSSINCDFDDDCTDDAGVCVASTPTSCQMNDQNVCTIGVAKSDCQFDWEGALSIPLPINISLGPEAVVVSNDVDVFVINDNSALCSASYAGCTEFGEPTYNQDKSQVSEFASIYFIDDPDNYEDELCAHDELFCEAWSTNHDGNFYFKDPVDQLCEWKDSVNISGQDYFGWFREGTTDPCYYDDEEDKFGTAYLIAGEESGVWRNGDTDYLGWAGLCDAQYDRCTEFLDPVDTSNGLYPSGTPYYYLDDDGVDEENVGATERCNGEVSQENGCVLFNDTTNSSQDYNSSASFISSQHADYLYGDAPYSSQPPINCDSTYGGLIETPDGQDIDLCWSQCRYDIFAGMVIVPGGGSEVITDYSFSGSSCISNNDCAQREDINGNVIEGTCIVLAEEPEDPDGCDGECPTDKLTNDSNRILKVYRDRTCAEWLTCSSYSYVWDDALGSWTTVCSDIRPCNELGGTGQNNCTNFPDLDSNTLDMYHYADRDVTWYGNEYSGFSIPESISVGHLQQVNVVPNQYCVNPHGVPSVNSETGLYNSCTEGSCSGSYTCEASEEQEFRLAYIVSSCTEDDNEQCVVGYCEDTFESCTNDGQCAGDCIVGYCKTTRLDAPCTTNTDCSGYQQNNLTVCEDGLCTTNLDETQESCWVNSDCGVDITGNGIFANECSSFTGAFSGTCLQGECAVAQNGQPFTMAASEGLECRGYPEIDSPYPIELVDSWKTFEDSNPYADVIGTLEDIADNAEIDDYRDAQPYDLRIGYENVNICAPNDEDCMCSYNKATYNNATEVRYYSADTPRTDTDTVMMGLCSTGSYVGMECDMDSDCGEYGTCWRMDSYNQYYGWEGYCLERDSQVYQWSDPNGDGVCLTWFPVDQMLGATDLYAKDTEAGLPLENQYYCAEVGYYRDFYVTGAVMNDMGEIESVTPACAESLHDNDYYEDYFTENENNHDNACLNEFDSCWKMAYCPDNYFAVVGRCNPTTPNDFSGACITDESFYNQDDHDCPYVCIPYHSYRYTDGKSCYTYVKNDTNLKRPSEIASSAMAGWCDETGNVTADTSDNCNDDHSYLDTEVFLAWSGQLDQYFDNNEDSLSTCVMRGVPMGENLTLETPENAVYGNVDIEQDWQKNFIFQDDNDLDSTCGIGKHAEDEVYSVVQVRNYGNNNSWDDHELDEYLWGTYYNYDPDNYYNNGDCHSDRGFWNLDFTPIDLKGEFNAQGAFSEYLGCYALVQTATADTTDGNKAYTQRLVYENSEYTTQDPGGTGKYVAVNINATDSSDFAGRALFEEYYELETNDHYGDFWRFKTGGEDPPFEFENAMLGAPAPDSAPLPVLAFDGDTYIDGGLGLYTRNPDHDDTLKAAYPKGVQFPGIDGYANFLGVPYELLKADGDEYEAVIGSVLYDYDTIPPYQFDHHGISEDSQTGSKDLDSAYQMIGQFFNKIYKVLLWDWYPNTGVGNGAYVDITQIDGNASDTYFDDRLGFELWLSDLSQGVMPNGTDFDFTNDIFETDEGYNYALDQGLGPEYEAEATAPYTISIGQCFGMECREDDEGQITINENDGDDISTGGGYLNATMKFFMSADPNQFPIRQVIVDWGDGERSGSQAQDNFYKARRGLLDNSEDQSHCDTEDEWGMTSESCEPSYMTYMHDYVCSEGIVLGGGYPECIPHTTPDGKEIVLNSPCLEDDQCVYQPKIFIKDNWGYCTGTCEGGTGEDLCYDDEDDGSYNECDLDCPDVDPNVCGKADDSLDTNAMNPWLYFDGQIRISPY
jgi:hypothetical protein